MFINKWWCYYEFEWEKRKTFCKTWWKKVKLQEKKEQAKINHEERKLNLKESYTVELPRLCRSLGFLDLFFCATCLFGVF